LHRVLKIDRHSPLLYKKALLTNELHEIFAKADVQSSGTFNDSNVLAEREVGYITISQKYEESGLFFSEYELFIQTG
jgi:hypothetical protein